ncbi:MAG: hypothetical protein LBB72_01130 [Spirochaetaceae bacterium]|jgi:hypothetical protein|nr:hypothetical protein [Spirochaetaceae bacterium]
MKKRFLLIAVFCLLGFSGFYAAEYKAGRIRLELHEDIGRFSLYYMADAVIESYLPLFIVKDPRSSFLSLQINNQSYRLGEDTAFVTKLGGTSSNPALIFESSFVKVTEEFAFIRTASFTVANGVRITITVANKTGQSINAGIRFLIDTSLGEKEAAHFLSDKRQINDETVIDFSTDDSYWVSGDKNLALMGSLLASGSTRPSFVHFANWKRFNDAGWEFSYVKGRDFNLLPYSIADSAVCYFFQPEQIPAGGSRTITIMLAAKDERGFSSSTIATNDTPPNYAPSNYTPPNYTLPNYTPPNYTPPDYTPPNYTPPDYTSSDYTPPNNIPPSNNPPSNNPPSDYPLSDPPPVVHAEGNPTVNQRESEIKQSMQADLYILQDLMNRLQEHNVSRRLTDDELTQMKLQISRIKEKYNIP